MMWVDVKILSKHCNPLLNPPWEKGMKPISKEEIENTIKFGKLKRHQAYSSLFNESRKNHIERIAWLVINGWGDSYITIDFKNDWILHNGNHRLASAIIRNDDMIWSEVFGNIACIKQLYV